MCEGERGECCIWEKVVSPGWAGKQGLVNTTWKELGPMMYVRKEQVIKWTGADALWKIVEAWWHRDRAGE